MKFYLLSATFRGQVALIITPTLDVIIENLQSYLWPLLILNTKELSSLHILSLNDWKVLCTFHFARPFSLRVNRSLDQLRESPSLFFSANVYNTLMEAIGP